MHVHCTVHSRIVKYCIIYCKALLDFLSMHRLLDFLSMHRLKNSRSHSVPRKLQEHTIKLAKIPYQSARDTS